MSGIELRFPDAYLETGEDDDHSYMSIKTTRQSDGSLKIDIEGWHIREMGPFLNVGTNIGVMKMRIIGRCGTVFDRTWSKVSFSHIVERKAEDQLRRMEYDEREKRITMYKGSPPTISAIS